MGRILLCLGKYAAKPYFMKRAYINVYSIEELCYCLLKNGYFADEEIMDDLLPDWLEKECGLKELSSRLRQMKEEGGTVSDCAALILDYVGYGEREDIERAKSGLEKETGLSIYEKRKTRADYLAENQKYAHALKVYDSLLEGLPEGENGLRAKILHNRGVAYAGLFRFRDAAESFRLAFECTGGEASYIGYLTANRMYMEETDYLNFTSGKEQGYEQTLQVEKRMEKALEAFEGTEENRMLFTLKVCKEEGNGGSFVSYYEEIEKITDDLKEEYRQMIEE